MEYAIIFVQLYLHGKKQYDFGGMQRYSEGLCTSIATLLWLGAVIWMCARLLTMMEISKPNLMKQEVV